MTVDGKTDPGKFAHLESRVGGVEVQLAALAVDTKQQFHEMRQETATSLRSIAASVGDLQKAVGQAASAGKISLKDVWPAMAAMTGFMGLIGAILYAPINASIYRLEAREAAISAAMVPRVELDWKWRHAERDLDRIETGTRRERELLESRLDRFERRDRREQ